MHHYAHIVFHTIHPGVKLDLGVDLDLLLVLHLVLFPVVVVDDLDLLGRHGDDGLVVVLVLVARVVGLTPFGDVLVEVPVARRVRRAPPVTPETAVSSFRSRDAGGRFLG